MMGVVKGCIWGALLSSAIVFFSYSNSSKISPPPLYGAPFECGFNPMAPSRGGFSVHFFVLGIVFLVFDMEVVILFPLLGNVLFWGDWISILVVVFFLLVLLFGVYYEWGLGMLEWKVY